MGLIIFFYGIKYRLPTTSNPVTSLEAIIFKYLIIIFGLILIMICSLFIIFRCNIRKFLRSHRNLPKNILLSFVTIIIFLLIFEVILVISNSLTREQGKQTTSNFELHHVNVPLSDLEFNSKEWNVRNKINSIGLRDYEILPKTDKTRILMLGDSMTFGYGIELEDTFSKQLEMLLNKNSSPSEVINAAVITHSPILEYVYLRNEGLKLKPDIVILNFDMSDVVDDYRYNSSAIYENKEIIGFKVNKERSLVNIFLKSYIIQFIKSRLENMILTLFENKVAKSEKNINNDCLLVLRENPGVDLIPYWDLTLDYIKKIKKLAEKNDIKFILHVFPHAVQVDGEEWCNGRAKWGFTCGKTYTTKPFEILSSFAEKNDILIISGLDNFKKSLNKPLFFSYDLHINEKGHLLIANYIYENLISNKLI